MPILTIMTNGTVAPASGCDPQAGDKQTMNIDLNTLATAIGHLGSKIFYQALVDVVRSVMPQGPVQVIRYSRHVSPTYIASHQTSDTDREAYISKYYRYDPMYHRMFSRKGGGTVHLQALLREGPQDEYMTVFFPDTGMVDDLGMLFETMDESLIGVFVQSHKRFSHTVIERFEALNPLLRAMLETHNRTALIAVQSGDLENGLYPFSALFDGTGKEVMRAAHMHTLEADEPELSSKLFKLAQNPNSGPIRLKSGILRVIELGDSLASMPGYRVCFYERGTPAETPVDLRHEIARFLASLQITERQTDILNMVLRGYPSSLIATKLDLSEGTVRNHRKDIYDRLDVTTEREVFRLFLDFLMLT